MPTTDPARPLTVTLGQATRHGQLTLDLWPELGGAIAAWNLKTDRATIPLFRPATEAARSRREVTALGSFPLVPFSNRIRDGRFDFAGRRHQLPRSFAAVAHPLHGHGWQSAWTLTEHSAACAELLLRHPADDWPWRYWARQRFTLDDSGLHHELDLHNDSDEPMPAGVGLHPYFVRSADVRLFAQLPQVWPTDADCLPSAAVATPAAWDFTAGRRIAELALDHCFSGWDGRAVIDWPTARCRLVIDAAPPLTTLVIYSPAGGDFFCVEPVSHVTDAINLSQRGVSGTGAAVLLPGQTLHASTRFGIELY